jgi:hypothetical protein
MRERRHPDDTHARGRPCSAKFGLQGLALVALILIAAASLAHADHRGRHHENRHGSSPDAAALTGATWTSGQDDCAISGMAEHYTCASTWQTP